MEAVYRAVVVDRAGRGHQGLAGDLPAEDPLAVLVGIHPSEDVDLDRLEVEKVDQGIDERLLHGAILPAGFINSGPPGADKKDVTVTSTPVTTVQAPTRSFIADHGEKLMRYCGVSVVNVITGQGILALCLAVFVLGGVVSQLISAMLSAIPAYVLSRRWVWKQTGRDSFRTEVLPFWTMALIGLVFAVTAIAVMEQFTDSTPVLMATSLAAYGVVWVAKYLVLDKIMWRTPTEVDAAFD